MTYIYTARATVVLLCLVIVGMIIVASRYKKGWKETLVGWKESIDEWKKTIEDVKRLEKLNQDNVTEILTLKTDEIGLNRQIASLKARALYASYRGTDGRRIANKDLHWFGDIPCTKAEFDRLSENKEHPFETKKSKFADLPIGLRVKLSNGNIGLVADVNCQDEGLCIDDNGISRFFYYNGKNFDKDDISLIEVLPAEPKSDIEEFIEMTNIDGDELKIVTDIKRRYAKAKETECEIN